jgi:hypothetical protein
MPESEPVSVAETATGLLALAPPGRFINSPAPAPATNPAVTPRIANFFVVYFGVFMSCAPL